MSKHNTKWFHTNNIYLFLLYKLGIALIGVLLAQLFFHICANRLYDITGFSTWVRLIWGNIVYSLAAVTMVLLPYLSLYPYILFASQKVPHHSVWLTEYTYSSLNYYKP